MRRNLRLDWRALALLGALLSIIIDWPGLVYAMPTILPPVAEVAAPAPAPDTLILIKNDKILNLYPFEEHDREHHVRPSVKDEFTGQSVESSSSFPTNRPFRDVQTERTTTKQEQQPDGVSVSAHEETKTQQERRLTTNEKHGVNENLNSISHKQIIDNDGGAAEEAPTAIHSNKTQQNSLETQTTTATGAEDDDVSSTNTHINDAFTPTTSSPLGILSSITTTESSAKIQSTLMPTTIIDNDKANESEIEAKPHHILSTFQFSSKHHLAILSRTERSIRSSSLSTTNTKKISGPSSTYLGGGGGGGGGTAGSTGMVRRSSDMSGGVKTKRLNNSRNLHNKNNLDRNERSTVSHLSGPSRKIQLYIKNRFLQLMPDGTVNGSQDELSEYTILQRSTVDVGRIKVQGVATCLYLCMDPCGAVYGSKDFTDDCVFNENMEQHNYNTYSSTYNSNARRKYYLALNRHGEPRKLQIPPTRSLGKLATYTNAITETVPQERVEQLIAKNFGANRIKHGIRQLCDTGKPLIELIDSKNFKAQPKCNPNSNSNSNSNSHSNSNNSSSNKNNKNSLSSSSSVVSSNSGQLLNNVPAANDKRKLSNSSSSSSSSRSSSNSNSKPETNSSSTTSQSSISNSQNNGHISNSSSSSSSSTTTTTNSNSNNSESSSSSSSISTIKANSHSGDKGKKLRKCRPHENEEEHNCHRRPHALRNPGKQRRCKELLLQQQQDGVTEIVLPPMCKKKGPKKQGAKNKRPPGEARGKNGLGTDGLGPNNRRGKKLNNGGGNGRQPAKQNQNGGNGGVGGGGGQKKKQKNANKRSGGGGGGAGGGGGVNGNKRKQQKTSTSTTSTTTEHTSTSDSTSTLKSDLWETSSFMPSSTLFETYDPHAESTSDRGDREQRNVRYANSMELSMEVSAEDTSAANDDNGDDDVDVDGEAENVDDNEEASYEDDTYVASSSHMPYAETDAAHIPLTGGADDYLYYDQLDV